MELEKNLTESEINDLSRFINDKSMSQAVKKVILSSIYFEGTIKKKGIPDPNKNFALKISGKTDKEIGAELRASIKAIELLEIGFKNISRFGKNNKQDKFKGRNPAR